MAVNSTPATGKCVVSSCGLDAVAVLSITYGIITDARRVCAGHGRSLAGAFHSSVDVAVVPLVPAAVPLAG